MSKILIVDDSAEMRDVMQTALEYFRYTVQTLSDEKHIQERITEFQPGLIILDVHLGATDGRDICKQLKTNASTKYIPILLFSATPEDLMDYKDYYADDYMEKPFDLAILRKKIKLLLNVSSSAGLTKDVI